MHLFGHMSPNSVTNATSIKEGDYLGLTGNTGSSSGAHLHYEIRQNPQQYTSDIDPNATTGKGRTPMFAPRKSGPEPHMAAGGPKDTVSYEQKLDQIYAALQQIASNPGASLKFMGNNGKQQSATPGRGGNNTPQQQVQTRVASMDKYSHASNGLGMGYQRLARGYS